MEETVNLKTLSLIVAQGQQIMFDRSEDEDVEYVRSPKKRKLTEHHERITNYIHVIHRYNDEDFKSHFRMSRTSMDKLINTITNEMNKEVVIRGRPRENVFLQVLISVWTLANQESCRSIADRFNVSKSSVFTYLGRVCDCLNTLSNIQWPTRSEALSTIEEFKKQKGFTGVLGCIDGCHIDIKPPKENSNAYVNRKGRPSMILQGVCDNKCKFIDCFVGYPGSVHDARVFFKSGMAEKCTKDTYFPNESYLLGDSAYPLGKHLIVPFKDNGHLTQKQIHFNVAHASVRSVIERTFGMLKAPWRRLKYLELHNSTRIPYTIMAACCLHNFCIEANDTEVEEEFIQNDTNDSNEASENFNHLERNCGVKKRNEIVNNL